MRKYVYLFELDSVRKTDAEIIAGQCALYDEIVKNGNIVVLTYNQLIDSRAFFSLLDNREYYESILKLFEKGYICISQFGTIRTIAQYLLNTIDSEENKFIYSALPIKSSQRRLVELIKRSVMYSDLSEINGYIQRIGRTDDELRDLFVEVDVIYINGVKEISERSSQLTISDMNNVLEKLYGLLGMVLRLSTIHDIFISPREPSEYSGYKLKDYLNYVSAIALKRDTSTLWNDAVSVLKQMKCWGSNNRSMYFREIKKLSEHGVNRRVLQYAEAIVSTCTNYAYEMSICNISKHYNAEDIMEKPSVESSFFKDFLARLEQHWNSGSNAENRFLQRETNDFAEFTDMANIPCFEEAARVVPQVEYTENSATLHRYEFNLKVQRRVQKLLLLKKMPGQIGSLLFVCLLAMLLNVLFEVIHNLYVGEFSLLISWASFFSFGIETINFFVIGELVTTVISNRFPKFLSLSEACQGLVRVFKDACHLLFSKPNTYVSECAVEETEKRSKSAPIDFSEPLELKKYTNFYKSNSVLVAQSYEYPIADVTDRKILKAIVRNQELYKRKYGIVYNSAFNMMVVDPIESDGNFFSYERVVPSVLKNGVVLFTVCKGKIVLLRQFRHAIRKEQLCCPRGFGVPDISTVDNAKKELREELGTVVIEEPVELGVVTADSGLCSGSATVFLMKIEEFSNRSDEGIREIVAITPEEMQQRVKNGEIDDGYTLAALTLYSTYVSSKSMVS